MDGEVSVKHLKFIFRTILYFSVVYIVGNLFMVIAAIPSIEISPILATILGLSLISIGTGGTKPCVAAFGGDQFYLPIQRDQLQQFFSLFYFAINLGGFVGMILTPILRKAVTCFGDDTCYALGFGFPGVLMVLSLLLFILGKPWYRMKEPKSNVMLEFVYCTYHAIAQRINSKTKLEHWLDYSMNKKNKKLIKDMKVVYAVLLLYTPLPLFWSLFDQQGSRWTFQASRMDGFFMGLQIVPDQMQVINPALVLFFIPFFDKWFYPMMQKKNFMTNHLHRMAVGGLIAGLAFIFAGILELVLETNYPKLPDALHASVNVINTVPCAIAIISPFTKRLGLNASEMYTFENIPAEEETEYNITVIAPSICGVYELPEKVFTMKILAVERQVDTIVIAINRKYTIEDYVTDPIEFKRSLSGKPRLRIVFLKTSRHLKNVTVAFASHLLTDVYYFPDDSESMLVSDYLELPAGGYKYLISAKNMHSTEGNVHLALGGVYTLILCERNSVIEFNMLYTMSPPNNVNIMWLVPQYFLISIAEIMFGIAGLEFSFTQAPKSMKTVTIASWYLSVAIGNLMVIVVAQANVFKSQAHEFFLFAVLIIGDMMIFTQMASNYRFVELEADSSVYIMSELQPLQADSEDEQDFITCASKQRRSNSIQ